MTAHTTGRVETPSPGCPADLGSIRGSSGRLVCFPGILPLPTLLLPVEALLSKDALAHGSKYAFALHLERVCHHYYGASQCCGGQVHGKARPGHQVSDTAFPLGLVLELEPLLGQEWNSYRTGLHFHWQGEEPSTSPTCDRNRLSFAEG